MSDDDFMSGLEPDAERPDEPDHDSPEPVHSGFGDIFEGDTPGGTDITDEEKPDILIDPRISEFLDELYGTGGYDIHDFFVHMDEVAGWDDVRGQHFSDALSALEYIEEGGMFGIAYIFYDDVEESWRVWVAYDTNH